MIDSPRIFGRSSGYFHYALNLGALGAVRFGPMIDLNAPKYPPQKPELLTNMGYALTPFTSLGVSGYTLHRLGHLPVVHCSDDVRLQLPHVSRVRSSMFQSKVTAFELERFLELCQCSSPDQFVLAKLAMHGLLTNPQDLWEVCCGYERRQVELRTQFADYQFKRVNRQYHLIKLFVVCPRDARCVALTTRGGSVAASDRCVCHWCSCISQGMHVRYSS